MSAYQGTARLRQDLPFMQRTEVCCFEQGNIFQNSGYVDFVALAQDVLKAGMPSPLFYAVCNSPGFGDKADDTTQILDADILAAVQGAWPAVAKLLYPDLASSEDGSAPAGPAAMQAEIERLFPSSPKRVDKSSSAPTKEGS